MSTQILKNFLPTAEGIARLFHPLAEVVIHDLHRDEIYAIFNPISRREKGDASYLERIDFDVSENVIGPYEKSNWDGRELKSISIVLKNDKGEAQGFLCINLDVSRLKGAQALLLQLLQTSPSLSEQSQVLFKDDLYEQVNLFVQDYCRERRVALEALSRSDKKNLVRQLEERGAFEGKNAATYVARVLKISRATVYNYLKTDESRTHSKEA